MKAALFDTGAGNLHSLGKALARGGVEATIETDPRRAVRASLLVIPGVGSFATAAARLAPGREAIRDAIAGGLPCIGICLGLQLLFERSEEGPGHGLGVFPGAVTRLAARRVPQIGWNTLEPGDPPGDALFRRATLDTAYFAHGYACRPDDPACVIGWCTHEGDRFPAVVRASRVIGVQFHPEKSSEAGVAFLGACVAEVTCA